VPSHLDHARKHKTGRRGGNEIRVTFRDALAKACDAPGEQVAIDEALERLAAETSVARSS
jgi:hypothetical protein